MSVQPSLSPTQHSFEALKVGDVMHPGVVSCPPDASLHAMLSDLNPMAEEPDERESST